MYWLQAVGFALSTQSFHVLGLELPSTVHSHKAVAVGLNVGTSVGLRVGTSLGASVGALVGASVAAVGGIVGLSVGDTVGALVGVLRFESNAAAEAETSQGMCWADVLGAVATLVDHSLGRHLRRRAREAAARWIRIQARAHAKVLTRHRCRHLHHVRVDSEGETELTGGIRAHRRLQAREEGGLVIGERLVADDVDGDEDGILGAGTGHEGQHCGEARDGGRGLHFCGQAGGL